MSRFLERLDLQQRNLLASSLCSAWLALRLEFLAVIVIAFLSALAMVQYQFSKGMSNNECRKKLEDVWISKREWKFVCAYEVECMCE